MLAAGGMIMHPAYAQLPTAGGYEAAPDSLLLGSPAPGDFHSQGAGIPLQLTSRAPTTRELPLIDRARRLLVNGPAKAIALIQDRQVIWAGYRSADPATTYFHGLGLGKTITALAAGKAICSGRLSLDSTAAEIIPELRSTDLGKASLRQLLTMSSGSWEGYLDATVIRAEQASALQDGKLGLLDILRSDKVSRANRSLLGTRRLPGEEFAFHSTDALTVGLMIRRATASSYARYLEQEILLPAGIAGPAIISQDRSGNGLSDSPLTMTLEDWLRVSVWMREKMDGEDCFAKFLEDATTTRIANHTKKFGSAFDGYGYFIWTDNSRQRDSFWAMGYGGQRIGWNRHNRRIIVAFSNVENYMDELYLLYREWSNLP